MGKQVAINTTAKALNKALQQPAMPIELLCVANKHLEGESIADIAAGMGCSEERVVATLDNSSVKRYINTRLQSVGYLNRKNRVQLIDDLIDEKIRTDGLTTDKDITELIKLQQAEQRELADKAPTNQVNIQNNKTTNIENLISRIAENNNDKDDEPEIVDAEVLQEIN